MDYSNWKILKSELDEHLEEYAEVAKWCNENGYHIEDDGEYYKVVINPPLPEPTIQQQIETLEAQITDRNIRSAIMGDEYALNKMAEIEAQIAELRKQLDNQNNLQGE